MIVPTAQAVTPPIVIPAQAGIGFPCHHRPLLLPPRATFHERFGSPRADSAT